jgi:hypothetical protein
MLIAGKRFHRIASGDSSLLKDGKVEASPTAAHVIGELIIWLTLGQPSLRD